jgi:hypothetical protein
MIRRLRALWADLRDLGDPFAVDTDWHHDLETEETNRG